MSGYELYNDFKIAFETPDDGYSYFFGYYDKSPLNKSNTKLLAHRVSFDGRDVRDGDVADVGYFDLSTKNFHKVDETLAWNWQQGSQLQWMPPAFEDEIIYNSIRNEKFVSIRYNICAKEKRVIPFPVYVIHPNGKEALAVNYERLYWCRPGYNYQNIKNSEWNMPIHPNDGIFRVDLETGNVKLIIRTQDVVDMSPNENILSSNNWLEHMMYNPSGNRFLFFYRWSVNGVDKSRFFTCARDGADIVMYPDCGFYSHYDWSDDKSLIVWTYEPQSPKRNGRNIIEKIKEQPIAKLLKPLYRVLKPVIPDKIKRGIACESNLIMFQDITLNYNILGDSCLQGNGHTTVIEANKLLLNDSYQDNDLFRHLYYYDLIKNKRIDVGKFYSMYNDCGYRCDLHPRLSINDDLIIIDSAHAEKRKIFVIKRKGL